jgi:hypothetical protein
METYRGVAVYMHISLTSALIGGEWSVLRPGPFTTFAHWVGGWVGPRASLDDTEKWKLFVLPGLEFRPLSRPARDQSLHLLKYL